MDNQYAHFVLVQDEDGRKFWRGGMDTEEEDDFRTLFWHAKSFAVGTKIVMTEPIEE